MIAKFPPPRSEAELLHRAAGLSGSTLAQLARLINAGMPENRTRAKGWIGAAVEVYLGAAAASRPEPDFQHLGVELKTIPVNRNGRPRESTFVCTVPLTGLSGLTWENSTVRKKLNRVLWVPIEADAAIAFPERRIGNAILWSPDPVQESELRTDWEEFIEMISLGDLDRITPQYGKVMQIRPKAMHSRALTTTDTETGERGLTLPRGFYLRSRFTGLILERAPEQ